MVMIQKRTTTCVSLPVLSINDVTVTEGNSGITNATFTVSLNQPAGPGGVTFNIATANGTATAGSDYVAQNLLMIRIMNFKHKKQNIYLKKMIRKKN